MQGGVEEEEGILICLRYALIKRITGLFTNFSQHGGGASQFRKLLLSEIWDVPRRVPPLK